MESVWSAMKISPNRTVKQLFDSNELQTTLESSFVNSRVFCSISRSFIAGNLRLSFNAATVFFNANMVGILSEVAGMTLWQYVELNNTDIPCDSPRTLSSPFAFIQTRIKILNKGSLSLLCLLVIMLLKDCSWHLYRTFLPFLRYLPLTKIWGYWHYIVFELLLSKCCWWN